MINDDDVGQMYKSVISNLGMEYSPAKTHRSEHFYEFAKRYFYRGVEISPFPYSALKECGKSFVLLTTLLFEVRNKGWECTHGISSSVRSYFSMVKNVRRAYSRKIEEHSSLCEGVLLTVHGQIPANE